MRRRAEQQERVATRSEVEARDARKHAEMESAEPRRTWALRAADVAALDALEQRAWADELAKRALG
jgi:hypothetical protein